MVTWIELDEDKVLEEYSKVIEKINKSGWRCAKTDKPPPETPVLTIVDGLDVPIVLELRWEICNEMVESYFKDFLYWDDPNNDGQDFEDRVAYWCNLPEEPRGTSNPDPDHMGTVNE